MFVSISVARSPSQFACPPAFIFISLPVKFFLLSPAAESGSSLTLFVHPPSCVEVPHWRTKKGRWRKGGCRWGRTAIKFEGIERERRKRKRDATVTTSLFLLVSLFLIGIFTAVSHLQQIRTEHSATLLLKTVSVSQFLQLILNIKMHFKVISTSFDTFLPKCFN